MATVETVIIGGSPSLAADVAGEGELLLFLHGIGGNRSNWRRQLDAFSQSYRCVALDGRGYGLSADYEGPVTFDIFASDVLRVLDHFGAEKAHICGLSLGGRIAQRFYAHHPDRVASLTLADSRPDTADSRSPEDRDAFFNSRAKPLIEGGQPSDIAAGVSRSLASPNASEEVLAELRASISALRVEPYLKAIRANLDDDYAGDISKIAVPTLVVAGEFDTLTPPAMAQAISAGIPGSQLSIIPGAGHLSNIENAEAFNRVLGAFLARVSRG